MKLFRHFSATGALFFGVLLQVKLIPVDIFLGKVIEGWWWICARTQKPEDCCYYFNFFFRA